MPAISISKGEKKAASLCDGPQGHDAASEHGSCDAISTTTTTTTTAGEPLTSEQLRRIWLEFGDNKQKLDECKNVKKHSVNVGPQLLSPPSPINNNTIDVDDERKNLDSGYAWIILIVMFLLQSSISGANRIYGIVYAQEVALDYYNREQASWPITSASFVENLAGLMTPALINYFSWRQIELFATVLFISANSIAYLSDSLWLDIIALGVVQGCALSISTVLALAINNDYFERYRSTAYGISMSGSAFGVLYLTPLVSWLLETYVGQFRMIFLVLAILFSFNIFLVLFIKPRHVSLLGPGASVAQAKYRISATNWPASSYGVEKAKSQTKISRFEEHFESESSVASISYNIKTRRQSSLGRCSNDFVPARTSLVKSRSGIELGGRVQSAQTTAIDSGCAPPLYSSLPPSATKQKSVGSVEESKIEHKSAQDYRQQQQRQKQQQKQEKNKYQDGSNDRPFTLAYALELVKTPYLHCTWIMLALYFLIARIFVMILVDFADDHGFTLKQSTNLLNFWAVGELLGRLFLGSLIDLHYLSCKHCIVLTCSVLAAAIVLMVSIESYFVYAACSLLSAALISFEYMLINVLMVEYMGKECVTSCYSLASFICSGVLFARPALIGSFRDRLGSYDGLLLLLAIMTLTYALLFGALEPLFVARWPRPGNNNQKKTIDIETMAS